MKIKLPKNPITPEEVKQKNRKMFSDDLEKGGILAKTLVFCKMNEPIASHDLKIVFQDYYHIEFDKNLISKALKRLNEISLLHSITSGELMTMPQNELEENELYQTAYKKFFIYLDHIPKQFRRQYNRVTYFWVSNGEGNNYLEWCCKLLGFEIGK